MSETKEARTEAGGGNLGVFRGVPGRSVENVGLLDLRGADVEELKAIESLRNIGAVLIDADRKAALSHVVLENVGSLTAIPADMQVMVGPWQEFSRATVEALSPEQKLLIVGMVLFKPDVPADLVADRFAALEIVGIFLATPAVQGALLGKIRITGVTVTLPDREMPLVHNVGQNRVTPGYLKYLEDGSMYVNMGQTIFGEDVSEELLARKFASYVNVGQTVAPRELLDLLKARCTTNLGDFSASGANDESGADADAGGDADAD
ncbi:MAG: hypothetical protein SFU56_02485 [Capsulimonadales bacterium]|nr:hypothetical protein [Capsulimonadales bacterium]